MQLIDERRTMSRDVYLGRTTHSTGEGAAVEEDKEEEQEEDEEEKRNESRSHAVSS